MQSSGFTNLAIVAIKSKATRRRHHVDFCLYRLISNREEIQHLAILVSFLAGELHSLQTQAD